MGKLWASTPAKERFFLNTFLWACTFAHLGLFIASLIVSKWTLAPLTDNPLLGPDRATLLRLGATVTFKITADAQWWRLVSSPFLCAGTLHVWVTSSALWTFAMFLGNGLTALQIIVIFIATGLAGVTASANMASNYVTSAASGPIFGLIGATCAMLLLQRRRFKYHAISWMLLALVLALNIYMGTTPFVDNVCNTAGFIVGLLIGTGMFMLKKKTTISTSREYCIRTGSVLLFTIALVIIVLSLLALNLNTSPASGCCDKWVCVDTKLWDCDTARVIQQCIFQRFSNSSILMACPRGPGSVIVPPGSTQNQMLALCDATCGSVISENSPTMMAPPPPGNISSNLM